jgi:transcriptional regulator with XRE-family HTH domain
MTENEKPQVGQKIKILREMKNYTQDFMAKQLGISQRNYSSIEQGAISLTIDRLFEISQILGVTVNTILDFDQSKIFNIYNNKQVNGVTDTVIYGGIDDNEKKLYIQLIEEKDKRIEQLERELGRGSAKEAKTQRK